MVLLHQCFLLCLNIKLYQVGMYGEALAGWTQEKWNDANEQAAETFGGGGLPRPGEMKI